MSQSPTAQSGPSAAEIDRALSAPVGGEIVLSFITTQDGCTAEQIMAAALGAAKQPPAGARDAVAWPARFGCNGPEGSFWTDDSALANKLIAATYDRDEWTVTDTTNPTGISSKLVVDTQPAAQSGPSDRAIAQAFLERFVSTDMTLEIGLALQDIFSEAQRIDRGQPPAGARDTVTDEMVERALDAQPLAHKNNSLRVWQMIHENYDAEAVIRTALEAALTGKADGGDEPCLPVEIHGTIYNVPIGVQLHIVQLRDKLNAIGNTRRSHPVTELLYATEHCLSAAEEGVDYSVSRPMLDAMTTLGLMEKVGRGKWAPTDAATEFVKLANSYSTQPAATGAGERCGHPSHQWLEDGDEQP